MNMSAKRITAAVASVIAFPFLRRQYIISPSPALHPAGVADGKVYVAGACTADDCKEIALFHLLGIDVEKLIGAMVAVVKGKEVARAFDGNLHLRCRVWNGKPICVNCSQPEIDKRRRHRGNLTIDLDIHRRPRRADCMLRAI